MEETQNLRPLIYLDDVLLTEPVEIRGLREIPASPDGPFFDPDDPSTLIGYHDCIVNGRPALPVGPAVISMDRQTVIWRFKTTSFPRLVPSPRGGHHSEAGDDLVTTEDLMTAVPRFFVWVLLVVGVSYAVISILSFCVLALR